MNNRMPRPKKEKVVMTITFILFAFYAATLIFPFLWILNNSLKSSQSFFADVWGLPKGMYLDNYKNAFGLSVKNVNLVGMFGNSLILVVCCTLVSVFVPTLSAYVISKFDFPCRKLIYSVAIAAMLIPTVGSLSATYSLMVKTGLYGKYIGIIILASGGFGFNFVMIYGYFRSISWAYAESAMIDGASDFKVFVNIMMPQVMPALIALCIISAINYWNDYFTPYMYLREHPTVAVGMQSIVKKMSAQSDWPQLFAAMLISIVPVLVLFCLFQKKIMENTVAGGLKG